MRKVIYSMMVSPDGFIHERYGDEQQEGSK